MSIRKLVKYHLLIILFTGYTYGFSAPVYQDPPPPMMQSTQESEDVNNCGETVEDPEGAPGTPPPPPGLCLPINDYLLPLFLSGVALGAFQLFRIKKKQEELENSVQ